MQGLSKQDTLALFISTDRPHKFLQQDSDALRQHILLPSLMWSNVCDSTEISSSHIIMTPLQLACVSCDNLVSYCVNTPTAVFEPAIDKTRLDQAGKTESNRLICLSPFSCTNEILVRIFSVCVSQCLQKNKTRSYLIITHLQTTPYLIQTHSMLEMCRNLFLLISTSAKSWNKFNSFRCFGFDFHESCMQAVENQCQ